MLEFFFTKEKHTYMFSTFSKRTVAERPDFQSLTSAIVKYDTPLAFDVGENTRGFLRNTIPYERLVSLSIVEYSKILRGPVALIYYFSVHPMSIR
jgi:hypothetical protein